jgi:hypothetical protein
VPDAASTSSIGPRQSADRSASFAAMRATNGSKPAVISCSSPSSGRDDAAKSLTIITKPGRGLERMNRPTAAQTSSAQPSRGCSLGCKLAKNDRTAA